MASTLPYTPAHVCGLQGFGRGADWQNDVCPACESASAPAPQAPTVAHKEMFDAAGFVAALERAIAARGETAREVCAQTGVSETTLSRVRAGERRPDAASFAALCSWAGINPADFMPHLKSTPYGPAILLDDVRDAERWRALGAAATPEMIDAGQRALYVASHGDLDATDEEMQAVWLAMIAAQQQEKP